MLVNLSFEPESDLGIPPSGIGSLASRLNPGMAAGVADLILASMPFGRGPGALLSRSFDKTRSKLHLAIGSDGRFVAAPGFGSDFDPVEGLWCFGCFGFGGDTITGPPSLRFSPSQSSGSRAEKLDAVSCHFIRSTTQQDLQWYYDVHAKIFQWVGIDPARLLALMGMLEALRLRNYLDLIERCGLPDT